MRFDPLPFGVTKWETLQSSFFKKLGEGRHSPLWEAFFFVCVPNSINSMKLIYALRRDESVHPDNSHQPSQLAPAVGRSRVKCWLEKAVVGQGPKADGTASPHPESKQILVWPVSELEKGWQYEQPHVYTIFRSIWGMQDNHAVVKQVSPLVLDCNQHGLGGIRVQELEGASWGRLA